MKPVSALATFVGSLGSPLPAVGIPFPGWLSTAFFPLARLYFGVMTTASREPDLFIGSRYWLPDDPLFGLRRADRRQHVYIVGKSGTGKTTALATMILQDLKRGEGCAVLDPHGDLAERLLDHIPAHRINDTIYFNPADHEHPVAFNIFETVPPSDPRFITEKILMASGLISVFQKIWADFWGPRTEHLLRNAILALLEVPGSTLLGVQRLFSDASFRSQVAAQIRDPIVRGFWTEEFPSYSKNFQAEAVSPILNKVGQFLTSPIIRNIVCQPRSTIDPRRVINEGKILIANLSKGRLGEDNAALLGAMLVTRLQLAAMDRARLPEEERRDFWLYVDEFQDFATESFASILSEARKYRLGLICANQFITQLPHPLRAAVFGNVATLLSFRVGAEDTEILEPEFWPQFKRQDLVNLPNYRAVIKMNDAGRPQIPFTMQTVPLFGSAYFYAGHREKVIRASRERYGAPRVRVEDRLKRWIAQPAVV